MLHKHKLIDFLNGSTVHSYLDRHPNTVVNLGNLVNHLLEEQKMFNEDFSGTPMGL